jgi:hypothetical protein
VGALTDSAARSRLPHVLMMHGLCDSSLTTIVTVCRKDAGRSGVLAISMRKSLYVQSLDKQRGEH